MIGPDTLDILEVNIMNDDLFTAREGIQALRESRHQFWHTVAIIVGAVAAITSTVCIVWTLFATGE